MFKTLNPDTTGDPVKSFSTWMTDHPELFKPKYVKGDYHIRRGDPRGIEAAVHAKNYDPSKYPKAYHRKGKNGEEVRSWFFFPAPAWYVWALVPGESPGAVSAVQYSVPMLKRAKCPPVPESHETSMATVAGVGNASIGDLTACCPALHLSIQPSHNHDEQVRNQHYQNAYTLNTAAFISTQHH